VELLLLVSFGLVAALLPHFVGDAAVDAVALAAIGLYVVGTTWWAVVSAFSGLAMFPKLALIWLPAAAPLALLASAINAEGTHDYGALAGVVYLPLTALIVLAWLFATGRPLSLTDRAAATIGRDASPARSPTAGAQTHRPADG